MQPVSDQKSEHAMIWDCGGKPMPICILGVHRSGTSMITHLLHVCNMYLGPTDEIMKPSAEDNPDGYWENQIITNFNDEILTLLQGTWDKPPTVEPGWSQRPEFNVLRHRAKGLVAEFDAFPIWGWKDPRNTLTLEFWLNVFPDLKLVL